MASTYRTIEELYRTTLVALSESPEAWKAFLESAGRNYKLPFPEQALVHAQRPDAKAVLELERWDALFGRRVKRGSVGIAVFGAPGTGRLRYYFDVSDTAPGRAARPLPLWAGGPEQEAAIVGALHESFGADARKGTIEAIAEAASAAVRENAESAVAAIGEARGGSGLERLEAPEAGDLLLELAAASAAYEAASRCGIEGGALITPRAADALPMFGTVRAMNALGCRTASAAAAVLRTIAPAMRERAPEASHRTFAPLAAAVHNPAKEPDERRGDGDGVQGGRWSSAADPGNGRGSGGEPGAVRADEGRIPEIEQARAAGGPAGAGGAGEAPGRDGSPRGGDGGRPGGPRGEEQGVGRSGEGGGSGSVGGEDGRGGGSGPRSGGDEGRVRLEKQRGQEKTKTSRREAGD